MDSENNTASTLFHTEVMRNIYQISDARLSPTGDALSRAPGEPTTNSYLVLGEERALLFDLALDEPGLKEYAEKLAGRPVQLVLSHAHIDHIFHIGRFDEVWMCPADEPLLRNGSAFQPPVSPCPRIHPMNEGDTIDLGGRVLEVHQVPGHTDGSILLLDRQTRTLLSGDTVARRLLYGLHTFVPFDVFCGHLRRIQALDFDVAYSAHDRCALPKAHVQRMIDAIENELPAGCATVDIPGVGEAAVFASGDPYTLHYFDMAMPKKYME